MSIIAPFYNEGEGVDYFYEALCPIFSQVSEVDFEVVCIDDGSSDNTLTRLISIAEKDSRFHIIELSRNFGKEAALTAGLENNFNYHSLVSQRKINRFHRPWGLQTKKMFVERSVFHVCVRGFRKPNSAPLKESSQWN